jgi:hypothetical protein
MKKITRAIAILLLIAILPPMQVHAAESEKTIEVIYYEDGSYITIETYSLETRAAYSKTGQRVLTYRNSAGEELWEAVLRGSFTYDGSTSSCTSSSCTVTITNTSWYTISKVASKSGNTARVDLKMGRRLSGITIQEKVFVITLSCDANGNLI